MQNSVYMESLISFWKRSFFLILVVFILDSLLTGSSNCLYLTDVQDELAILYSSNEQTKKIALEKTDATKKQKDT